MITDTTNWIRRSISTMDSIHSRKERLSTLSTSWESARTPRLPNKFPRNPSTSGLKRTDPPVTHQTALEEGLQMKAIITKFHGPGNVKGSRYSASDLDGNRVIVSTDHELSSEQNHDRAALALCRMRGGLKHGNVYTFESEQNRVKVPA